MSTRLLTDQDAETIRVKYWQAKQTQRALAKRYHVSITCIHKIVFGETYKRAPGPTSNVRFQTQKYQRERNNNLAQYLTRSY